MITPSFSPTATERVLPKLALDFTTASLDPRVTFTRALNTATRINSSGVIESVNADVPRFDYTLNTGGACKGLLIEEARTNLAFNSSNVLSGNWLQSLYNGGAVNYYTVTNGATPTPGPGNSNYFVATATPGVITARQTGLSLSSGATYTVSAYVYVPTQAGVTGWRFDVNYNGDYAAGTLQTTFDTWVRISATTTLTGARTYVDFNVLKNNGSTPTQGFAFYMTNMQIEAGAFATSYIPTTSAALTRNADVATMTGTNFSSWYNQTQGSFFVESLSCAAAGARFISVTQTTSGLTADNTIFIDAIGNVRGVVYSGSTAVAVMLSGARPALGTLTRSVIGYAVDNYATSLNGAAPATDNAGALPVVSNTQLEIGQVASGFTTTAINSHMRKISYWPQRLTNAEVQAFSK